MTNKKLGAFELPLTRNARIIMKKTVYETNYERLLKLSIFSEDVEVSSHRKSISDGFMDLVVERNTLLDDVTGNKGLGFSLAHYYVQNGDLCSDPLMEIIIYPDTKKVEAFSFEMSLPPVYQVVYPEPGKVYLRLRKELNDFLRQWLNNLIDQGHGKNWIDKTLSNEDIDCLLYTSPSPRDS